MKFFLLALSWLLLFENLQGSTLPHGRPVRALNTTLRTNFSGLYQRKNPCSGTDIETSSYKASHELHHHTKDDSWSDYTHKCSAIIRNFLQNIGNLIRFNHEPSGSFNFYLNTSISQKQRLSGSPKSCESLPTIVIEATDCNIPFGPCCQMPKGQSVKHKDEDRKGPNEEVLLPPADFSGQQDPRGPDAVPPPDTEQTPSGRFGAFPTEEAVQCMTSKSTTRNPGSEWSEPEESFREDDSSISSQSAPEFKFPTAFSPAPRLAEIAQQEVLYDPSRDTQSAYEPKTKYFKTSLRLTPQTDPENGTIQPRIHYMAANLVADPGHCEPAPQSVTGDPFPDSERPGPFMTTPTPFPEGPNYPIESTSPSLPPEHTPQVPLPAVAPPLQPYAAPNEPIQTSVTAIPQPRFSIPPSRTQALPETALAPSGEPFSTPTQRLPLRPARLFNDPPTAFIPENQAALNPINGPRFPPVPTVADYDPETPQVQSTPSLPPPAETDFPQRWSNVTSEPFNYSLALNRPPTAADSLIRSEPETFPDRTSNLGSQLNPPVLRDHQFYAQQISPPRQRFLAQPPYDSRIPSTIPPPRNSFEEATPLATQPPTPPLQPDDPDLPPGENEEDRNGVSISLPTRPSVIPYGKGLPPAPMSSTPPAGPPYSDSFITPFPRPDEGPLPVGSPLNFDFAPPNTYSGQPPTSDDQSTKQFKSSSVTTVVEEDTVVFNQKPTTPRFPLDATTEPVPESTAEDFGPSSPHMVPQQLISPDYLQPPTPSPFANNNVGDDRQPLTTPDRPLSSPFQMNTGYPEDSPKPAPALNPNNDRVPTVPETSRIGPAPSRQQSQQLEPTLPPEYDLQTDESFYATTPMPYAPILNPEKTVPDSPIAPEGKPSFPYTTASSATAPANNPDDVYAAYSPPTTQTYPLGEYNPQTSSQQLFSTPEPVPADEVPADGPLVGYSDRLGSREPPVSDSFVSGDYPTAAAPRPLTSNAGGFPVPPPDDRLAYDSAPLGQFPDSSQQERPPVNFENGPPAVRGGSDSLGPYRFRSEVSTTDSEQISESVSPDLPSFITPPPEVYALHPEPQPLASTSSRRPQESTSSSEQSSIDEISRLSSESAVAGGSEAVLSQELFGSDPNRRTNPAHVFRATAPYTEQNFQTSSQSTTPVYATQLPAEANSGKLFQPQILENKSGGRNPQGISGSSEQFSDGKQTEQTTDSVAPLRPLSSDSFPGNSDSLPPAFPSPNTFSGYIGATTPADFPPSAQRTNEEIALGRPSASPNSFVTSLPGGGRFPDIIPENPDFQQPSPNSQQLPGLPLSPDPRSSHWNDDFQQTSSLGPSMTTSSAEDRSTDSLSSHSVDTYAFPLPQDATVAPSTDSPTEYTLLPALPAAETGTVWNGLREEPQFFTTPQPESPQPAPPMQPPDQSTLNSKMESSISIDSQARSSDLLMRAPLGAPEYSFQQPLASETNSARPLTTPQVVLAEIIPTGAHSEKTVTEYEEEEETTTTFFTPPSFESNEDLLSTKPQQAFDGTSSGPQPAGFNSQSVGSASSLQETDILSGRESQPDDSDQTPNPLPVAEGQKDRTFSHTFSIEERTVTDVFNSDRFSTESTEMPVLESPQTLPESTAVGEIITARQQSFPPPDSRQPPNYAPQSSDEPSDFFVPLVPQQIPTPSPQTLASTDRPPLQEPQRAVGPPYFSSIPPPSSANESLTRNAESGLSQVNSNFQDRVQRIPEPFAPDNLQRKPDGPYNQQRQQPLPEFNQQPMSDSYNANFAVPPRAPLPDRYRGPNYMQNPLPDSPKNRPPFYGQRPMPQIIDPQSPPSAPLNLPQKSQFIAQQVTAGETTSQSSGPRTHPRLAHPEPPFAPDGQSPKSVEGPPAPPSPAYLQTLPAPAGPMPPLHSPHIPNHHAFRPEQPPYFRPPPPPPYPVNNDPRLRLQSQPNLPFYPDVRMNSGAPFHLMPLRDQRPAPPQINQVMDDRKVDNPRENDPTLRPNFDADPGREVDVLADGQALPPQTEERPPVDSGPGPAVRPETASPPYGLPPGPPTSPDSRPPLPNPLLQTMQFHLAIPTQEHPHQPPTSHPARSDQNEQLSFDTKNNSPAAPPYPGRWNPRPATNFVNVQQNTAFDAPRGAPQPHPHALLPHQTTPSNEPDPASTGRSDHMASPLRNSFYADRMRSGAGPERF